MLLSGPLKQVANLILFLLMLINIYSHYMLKEGLDKMTPACVFGLLLICRFIVRLQVEARERRQIEATSAKQSAAQHEGDCRCGVASHHKEDWQCGGGHSASTFYNLHHPGQSMKNSLFGLFQWTTCHWCDQCLRSLTRSKQQITFF